MLPILAAWARKHCRFPAMEQDLLQQAQNCEAQERNFRVLVGAQLAKSGVAHLIHAHGGELFVFSLTESQTELEDAQGSTMQFTVLGKRERVAEQQPLHLERLELSGAEGRSITESITGRCFYEASRSCPAPPCLELTLLLRSETKRDDTRRVCLYYYPVTFSGSGIMDFEYPPLLKVGGDAWMASRQVAVAFARFCTEPKPKQHLSPLPLSNALGSLLSFV